mmetsp:Transcript_41871/g.108406  ORF Transcript_41871/g.108406 Transcript_41871/m.108406 type:complete len:335 (+) Transcript_41871:244-1248(+)
MADVELCVSNPLLPKKTPAGASTDDLFPEIQPAAPLEAPRPAAKRGGARGGVWLVFAGGAALALLLYAALYLHNGVTWRDDPPADVSDASTLKAEAGQANLWEFATWEEGRLGGRRLAATDSSLPGNRSCPRYSVRTHAASTWAACNKMCGDLGASCGDFRLDLVDHVCMLQLCGAEASQESAHSLYDYHDNMACRGEPVKVVRDSSLEACEDFCDGDRRCQAYTYAKLARICRLMPECEDRTVVATTYSATSRRGNDAGMVAYILKAGVACKDPHQVLRDATLADCERACTAAGSGCVGFTYNPARRACYIKPTCDRLQQERADLTGMKVVQA